LDRPDYTQSRDYLLSTFRNREPIALHNFGSVPVEIGEYEDLAVQTVWRNWVLDCGRNSSVRYSSLYAGSLWG